MHRVNEQRAVIFFRADFREPHLLESGLME